MKNDIAILTQLAPFRRHLENYPSTMQRDRSAYTTWGQPESREGYPARGVTQLDYCFHVNTYEHLTAKE